MNKTQFYLSQCADAASKSPMYFTLGAVLVKGGKIMSSGYNHHRPHYDGAEVPTRGHRKPVSMHAEMHAIFNMTGMSPSFRKQQGCGGKQKGHRHLKGRSPPLHARGTRSVFKGPTSSLKTESSKKAAKRRRERTDVGTLSDGGAESSSSGGGESCGGCEKGGSCARGRKCSQSSDRGYRTTQGSPVGEGGRAWSARRRDSRVNGADIYVVRVNKVGMGDAKPCWRCLEWCRWAGVKRVFHWNAEAGRFDMVKVNTVDRDQYATHADVRLYAGMGW
ncbi:hypothetical protein BV25DRAFT_1870135 [Artomyces pyxidatus]|uniref:Uncharacterized protein n=1 Tax=Artomyces pyxidatus TaxID=48021 RepID=A0ACB8T2Q7_9AGAM|nr:hypothetical protein BV25DRAFT_1870135 [Artomyces pyxidatus]